MSQEFIDQLAKKLQTIGTLHAIGETWISIDSTIPAGGIPFLGQLVNRATWADLFAWASAQGKVKTDAEWTEYADSHGGNCPFYSDGDGSTNFRMPCIKGYLKNAEALESAGGYIAEGLPNIEGRTYAVQSSEPIASGAFTHGSYTTQYAVGGSTQVVATILNFSAKNSNSIYGNSAHVTPETNTILIGVYAVGIVANVGSADASQFLSGLAAVEAHNRVVETWKSEDETSWYRKWSDGWIEQGGIATGSSTARTISLPTSFVSANYIVVASKMRPSSTTWGPQYHPLGFSAKTTSSFLAGSAGDMGETVQIEWYACGY